MLQSALMQWMERVPQRQNTAQRLLQRTSSLAIFHSCQAGKTSFLTRTSKIRDVHTRKTFPTGARSISSTSVLGQENLGHGWQSSRQCCPLQRDHTLTFHIKGTANVAPAPGAPLSLSPTGSAPSAEPKAAAGMHMNWAGSHRDHVLFTRRTAAVQACSFCFGGITPLFISVNLSVNSASMAGSLPFPFPSSRGEKSLWQIHPTALAGSSSCTLGPLLYFQIILHCWCEACREQQTPESFTSPASTR